MCKNPDTTPPSNSLLPVIIAGAGPCGLVAALTLQKQGTPFVLYERASREKLCSNAGSGFDMAPTAVDILENKLQIDMDKAMRPYDYMYIGDMKGRPLSTYRLKDLPNTRDFGFANRSDLQNALLNSLMEDKPTAEEQEKVLKCGIMVTGYHNQEDYVQVTLSNGTTVKGSALLACDGIHSAVRQHMHRNVNDELHYCGQECWWGKTEIRPGSELDLEFKEMEKKHKMNSNCAISLLGTHKRPAANQTNDLTRRGGTILTEEAKRRELIEPTADRSKLLRLIIQETPASGITRAAFYDRENLDLPFVDGRVALLGDSAHPQSPMMGQGANMAIVDGYVVTTQLAAAKMNNIVQTLADYDCDVRRKGINKVIAEARFYGNWAVSSKRLSSWMLRTVVKYTPPSALISELVKGDRPNKKFVATKIAGSREL